VGGVCVGGGEGRGGPLNGRSAGPLDGRWAKVEGTGRLSVLSLGFSYSARHPDGRLLREWVRDLPGRRWDRTGRCWLVDAELLEPGVISAAGFVVCGPDGQPASRTSVVVSPGRSCRRAGPVVSATVPASFGLDLYDYQRQGAETMLRTGRMFVADEPGLGKTRTVLAVAAAVGARRMVVTAPAVVLTHWQREAELSGVCGPIPEGLTPNAPPDGTSPPGVGVRSVAERSEPRVVVVRPGRKEPALPEHGVVVVSDSMLAARPGLVARLCAWEPDVFAYDEVHRAKTWGSKRTVAALRLADAARRTVVASGTPILSRTDELVAPLAMTGALDAVFGGRKRFVGRYVRYDRFGRPKPVVANLAELGQVLDGQVWVRRRKADVLPDLPAKSRRRLLVDIDRADYDLAHAEVVEAVDEWLDGLAALPEAGSDVVWDWAHGRLELISRLRRAAGAAKVGAAAGYVADWTAAGPGGDGRWDRPLVVWAHHREVVAAVADAVAEHGAEVIDGSTSPAKRTSIVERFQDRRVAVLVASITAAGVGVTLTAASDVLFVEVDWTPALIAQAEDRCARIGQTRPVTVTSMVAAGTLDETVMSTLAHKAAVLESVVPGGDHEVARPMGSSRATAARLLVGMVDERIGRRVLAAHRRRRSA